MHYSFSSFSSFSSWFAALTAAAVLAAATPAQGPTKPGPEHQRLAAHVGTWDAVIESDGPDGPSTSKGVSVIRLALGGLWLLDDFTADFGDSQFQGHGVTGYDPAKGKYVGTWIDSWTPSVMTLEGSYDQAGKVLTMRGMGMGTDGKPAMHRMVTTHKDDNTMVFEMFVSGVTGKEVQVMKITYTRRPAKDGK